MDITRGESVLESRRLNSREKTVVLVSHDETDTVK